MSVALSICIPTHDGRAGVLRRALETIAAQLDGELRGRVQVAVSDNGSQDATQDVLAQARSALRDALVTHRFAEDRGFTENLLQAVALADGEFVWLLGSDDVIGPGGIARVLGVLDAHPSLSGLTTGRENRDEGTGGVLVDDPRILPPPGRTIYDDARTVFAELSMLQDYISTQVVRRALWEDAVTSLGPEGIAAGRRFPHLPLLGAVIRRDPRWYWLAEPVVGHRVGEAALTDTFGHAHKARYTEQVTADRAAIWAQMFGRRAELYREAMGRARLIQATRPMILSYKLQPGHGLRDDVRLLVTMVRFYGFLPAFWHDSASALLAPAPLVRLSARVVRRLRGARYAGRRR